MKTFSIAWKRIKKVYTFLIYTSNAFFFQSQSSFGIASKFGRTSLTQNNYYFVLK